MVDPASWQLADQGRPIPLQQHPVYGLALQSYGADAQQIQFSHAGTLLGTALIIQRKFFGVFRAATLFRGPLWHSADLSVTTKLACYAKLRAAYSPWRWNFLVQLPEAPADNETLAAFKQIGMKQIMSGFSTAWLDLRPEEESLRAGLKGKWRNQLVGAEKSALSISVGGRKPQAYDWLLKQEKSQRDNRRYQATPLGLVPAFLASATPRSRTSVISVAAILNRKKIAGALFLVHGNSATYHIGWAGEEARALNAQNLVLWQGILALKNKGIKFLDLGGLNTVDLAGIARFKLGTGATPLTLAGGYI